MLSATMPLFLDAVAHEEQPVAPNITRITNFAVQKGQLWATRRETDKNTVILHGSLRVEVWPTASSLWQGAVARGVKGIGAGGTAHSSSGQVCVGMPTNCGVVPRSTRRTQT